MSDEKSNKKETEIPTVEEMKEKALKIASNIPNLKEMTHKEFVKIARNKLKCKLIKRKISRCRICEALGFSQ